MLPLKICAFMVFMVLLVFCSAMTAKLSSENKTAEFLWKLYNYALQSRRNLPYPYPYSYKYPGKYPEYYQNYPANTYSQYPGSYFTSYKPYQQGHLSYKPTHLHGYPPVTNPSNTYPEILQHFSKPKESIMEVLYTIAQNDDLQCVPKLICEATSGTLSGRQQGLNLPVNINMESLLSFISTFNSAQASPLVHFGKAALLGFTSKGNTGSCNYAYPECPSDPDKVVKYLNNHNGGFFRFFGEGSPVQNPQNGVPYWRKSIAEQRIQNNAVDYVSNFRYPNSVAFEDSQGFRSEKGLKFPSRDVISNDKLNEYSFNSYNSLKFPNDEDEYINRKPKKLHYYSEYHQDLQKPLPNHKVTPMIFPDRTGTGDLRLDPEELQDYRRPISYQDDDVRVVFNGINSDAIKFDADYNRNGRGFSFPS